MTTSKPQYETYRLSGVPAGVPAEDIRMCFPESDRQAILHISRAPFDQQRSAYVFTITFSRRPESLANLLPTSDTARLGGFLPDPADRLSTVTIDAHFSGLTQLNDVQGGEDVVDIIAMSGLAGRPFGSWQCDDGSMWLRDYLPNDVPNARVFIYGYKSTLVKFKTHSTITTYSDDFLDRLERIRPMYSVESRRPLMLVGHSLGGMVIKNAWVRCTDSNASKPFYQDLRRAICGMVFFGTPHEGMEADAMIEAASGNPTEALVRDLQPGSTRVVFLKEQFAKTSSEINLVSCYETRETKTLKKGDNGEYARIGEEKLIVPQSSACLFWGRNETRIGIDENHSKLAKLSNRDESKYHDIKNSMARLAVDGRKLVSNRFLRAGICEDLKRSCAILQFVKKEANSLAEPERYLLSDTAERLRAFHSTLSDPQLGEVFLGTRMSGDFVRRFAHKSSELIDVVTPFEAMALDKDIDYQFIASSIGLSSVTSKHAMSGASTGGSETALFSPKYITRALQHVGDLMESQVQMLSLSMLREPETRKLVESESTPDKAGLRQIAAMQELFSSSEDEPQNPLTGQLTMLHPNNLPIGQYNDGGGEPERFVIVEYKRYALSNADNPRGMTKESELQAEATKKLAEKLATLLRKYSHEQIRIGDGRQASGFTPHIFKCLGYLDDSRNSRIALIYEIPEIAIGPSNKVSINVTTLKQLVQDGLKVPLEEKFQLAFRICSTVLSLHCSGWVHKSIRPENVVLIPKRSQNSSDDSTDPDTYMMKYEVYLKGFEFSREAVGKSDPFEAPANDDMYRHPDRQGLPSLQFRREHDLYAVGLILLEVGTGSSLQAWSEQFIDKLKRTNKSISPRSLSDGFKSIAKGKLRRVIGGRYAGAVIKCLEGAEIGFGVITDDRQETGLASAFQQQVVEEIKPGVIL